MRHIPLFMLAGSAAIFGIAASGAAHPNAADHESANVLPADLEREELGALMKHFSGALGVNCSYCHVGEEGAPLSTYDFESDAKAEKRTARQMLILTHKLNQMEELPGEPRASLSDMSKNRVTCYTCHRGDTHPETMVPQPDS